MICMKNLRFSSRPGAKVRRQGPPGSARVQPLEGIDCLETRDGGMGIKK